MRALVLAAALLWAPIAAEAQTPPRAPRLGYLWLGPRGSATSTLDGLREGLRELGYVEGQNIFIEYRYAGGDPERLGDLATDLVQAGVDVILAPGGLVTAAVLRATRTIPVVSTSTDPVALGFAASLARPGANVTGLSLLDDETVAVARLRLVKAVVPRVARVGILFDPRSELQQRLVAAQREAALGMRLLVRPVEIVAATDLPGAFAELASAHVGAILAGSDARLVRHHQAIVELAARHRLPAVYGLREYVEVGGLMAYSASVQQLGRRAASYVDRILRGARPAELPIEPPTKFELVINLQAGKAIGFVVPQPVLQRADEVLR
jgi:putative ABC transport system substrate-binding protein